MLLDRDGRPRLADFGLASARSLGGSTLMSKVTAVGAGGGAGSPAYMAPELAVYNPVTKSFGRPCPATDVYAFGVLAAEVLTRAPPYGDNSDVARYPSRLERLVAAGGRPSLEPHLLPPGTPGVVTDLVARCWAADPAGRPPMGDVVTALAGALDDVCGNKLYPAQVQRGAGIKARMDGLAARAMGELAAAASAAATGAQ